MTKYSCRKSLAHTVALTVVVNSGAVVIVIVLAVSQPPVVLATVSINVAGPLNT
jgi:hypothetical protein